MLRTLSHIAFVSLWTLFPSKLDPVRPDPNSPRSINAEDTVFIATGGIEQNGPYLVTGKHNYVLRATTELIARKLGNAMIAPIIAFVPE